MAGSPGTLTARGSDQRPAVLIAGLLVALGTPLCAGERSADVMIVEHPGELVVFNRYQQRLTPEEYRLLPPFVPMIILKDRDFLGDGFTPCASVEISGEPYYILRDSEGGISRGGEPGKTEIIRDVTLLGDTVVLLRGKALALRPAGARDEVQLRPGTRVLRIFEHESKTYVNLLQSPPAFGWLALPGPAGSSPLWCEEEQAVPGRISPEGLLVRVQSVVDGANRSLRSIYAALSPESGSARTPPAFRLSRSKGGVRCALEPAALSGSFGGSMRALLPELERVLGGTGLHAEISGDAIIIPLR